ncbi:sigma-54-dependent Fis family transcriptional regulator [uncultured Amphritea sp.]|uniref:sigma-54-dependent Fis family transcriptional regulator n=1 Tax=uncultured Amphritea sp. TaxID=981605 RepID=UPI00260646A9|nr:sigma-54-dependent Fis family transcriptional regulator [uncultured Amphritea sp.]
MLPNMSVVRRDFERGQHDLARLLDKPIFDSWQRCYSNNLLMAGHVDYGFLASDQFKDIFLFQKPLLDCSRKHLDALYQSLGGAGWSVLLTDNVCQVLDVRRSKNIAEPRIMDAFRQGAVLSEELIGTSAMSCAITSERFVSVFGPEHYKEFHKSFNCAAVPVYDPLGSVCATVDITNEAPNRDPAAFYLLEACARNIQNELIMSIPNAIVIELQSGTGQFGANSIVLAFSYEQTVIGANIVAERFFKLDLKHQSIYFEGLFDESFSVLFDQGLLRSQSFNLNLSGGISLHGRVLNVPRSEQERLFQSGELNPPELSFQQKGFDQNRLEKHSQDYKNRVLKKKEAEKIDSSAAKPYFGDQRIHAAIDNGLKAIGRLPVLILGESGVGKEVVARYLHQFSPARKGQLVTLNCASIPESLIESELFGYEAGTFTGASREGRAGKIQQANGGSLFLDEIGDMPVALQTRLLRVLETREVVRLGSAKSESVQFQLICATHKNISGAIENGAFRRDLFYRISGFEITIPPLRERDDIRGVSKLILADESDGQRQLTDEALHYINRYSWPGNVRELRNALIYADTLAEPGRSIEPGDLPDIVYANRSVSDATIENFTTSTIKASCDEMILEAIERFEGNLTQAAKYLGIARSTLYRKMEKLQS